MNKKVRLCLASGLQIEGEAIGKPRSTYGEVVFTTGMVGYSESLTDPSYYGQILMFTYPLIGNYGISSCGSWFESNKIHAKGVILSEIVNFPSHSSSVCNFSKWLRDNKIPGIAGVDTRYLTLYLRKHGVMQGCLLFNNTKAYSSYNLSNNKNLVAEVSVDKPINFGSGKLKIAIIDCGVKQNIIRSLLDYKVRITQVPWNWSNFSDFDGIVISNGPGNPKCVKETIENIKRLLNTDKPILGICLGNQLLALAAGADTYKLLYGHRSHNQPVLDKLSNKAFLTTQNHGFAVKTNTLGKCWKEWFINLNDKTNEGLKHIKKPFLGVQFHPEGSPGPDDTHWIFKEFIDLCKKYSF